VRTQGALRSIEPGRALLPLVVGDRALQERGTEQIVRGALLVLAQDPDVVGDRAHGGHVR
jgi:hypothetical protein